MISQFKETMANLHVPATAALLVATTFSASLAGTIPLPQAVRGGDDTTVTVSLDTTYLDGKAREHAFFSGYSERIFPDKRRHQVSRLDWEVEDVFLLGLSGSAGSAFASLNFGIWGGVGADGAGTMEDYDWLLGDSRELHGPLSEGASEYSRSDDTVTSAWIADANVSFNLLDKVSAFDIFPFFGLRYERYEWADTLEFSIYTANGWIRKDYGGKRGIEYRQEYFQPYFGLGVSWSAERLALSAYGRFAPVYLGKAHDNHLLRGYVTEETTCCHAFEDVAYGFGARVEWVFTQNLSADLGVDWTRYSLAEADVTVLAQDDFRGYREKMFGTSFAGMELQYLTFSVDLTWRF